MPTIKDLPVLTCMSTSCDGAHCGLTDWYPKIENGIVEALKGKEGWTTGWYASKKEIASAKIDRIGNKLVISVSVSNDFDCEGTATNEIALTQDLEYIVRCVDETWDEAMEDQKENKTVAMYSIKNKKGQWVETFLANVNPYFEEDDSVPGDNYHTFGWQKECKMPKKVREEMEIQLNGYNTVVVVGNWTATLCE